METTETLERKFRKIGADLKIAALRPRDRDFSINVQGKTFEIRTDDIDHVQVLDVQPKDKHLLLLARVEDEVLPLRFLCGHDERDFFVASVGGNATTVQKAKDSLKPIEVLESQYKHGVRPRKRDKRHTGAVRRTGEWFLIAKEDLQVDPKLILKNEPIVRPGGGKPHVVQEVYRVGGKDTYAPISGAGKPITPAQYQELSPKNQTRYRFAREGAQVYARGTIRHPDHKTVKLRCWHEVVMNREVNREMV